MVPTATSYSSRSSAVGDDGDAGDAQGRTGIDRVPAGGRAVAGSNPVAPTETTRPPASPASPLETSKCFRLCMRSATSVAPPLTARIRCSTISALVPPFVALAERSPPTSDGASADQRSRRWSPDRADPDRGKRELIQARSRRKTARADRAVRFRGANPSMPGSGTRHRGPSSADSPRSAMATMWPL